MPRSGLTPQAVTDAAAAVADRDGPASLTLARVAGELGVRSPSLYNHVDGLDALVRAVALDGVDGLADWCRGAVMGRSGADGLAAIARAYRAYAAAHPGVYALTQTARPGDAEYERRAARLLEPVLALLAGFDLSETERVHAARAVRSALHGFVMLEQQSGFGLDVDIDDSFAWMVGMLTRGLADATTTQVHDDPNQ
jgi:AcrR family transcriptional regulator